MSRPGLALLATAALAGSAPAAAAGSVRTPQQAVDAVARVLARTAEECRTRWTRMDAVGVAGDWRVAVRVRRSRAGDGIARFRIRDRAPYATNDLARAIARGCD